MRRYFSPFVLMVAILLFYNIELFARQQATVILKNTKRVTGEVVEDAADHITLQSDIGIVKIERNEIDRVLYETDAFSDSSGTLSDHVIVSMLNGDVFDGVLVSKGATALIIKTELGRMAVLKKDVKTLEYVSKAYAERGEPVRLKLQDGQVLDGYLYYEDKSSITITTKNGRLTLAKENLRSISYNVPVAFQRKTAKNQEYQETPFENPYHDMPLRKRMDSFELGYASQFRENYGAGGGLLYKNLYLLKDFNSFSFNIEADLGVAGFSLNQNALVDRTIPGAVSASGGAVITSLIIGSPTHFYPNENAPYEFFVTPSFETHLVYASLKKEYPSFPTLNSEQRDTKLRYGIGTQIGLEWSLTKSLRIGLSWNSHYLFNDSDFSTIAIHVGTRLY